jgi:hypothetical protein
VTLGAEPGIIPNLMNAKLLPILLLIPGLAWAGTYKCTGEDGTVSFQQMPCETAHTQLQISTDGIKPPTPVPVHEERELECDYYSVENQLDRLESRKHYSQSEFEYVRRRELRRSHDKDYRCRDRLRRSHDKDYRCRDRDR